MPSIRRNPQCYDVTYEVLDCPRTPSETSEIVRQVVAGESFIIENRGVPVAEIHPISDRPKPRMPNREAPIMGGPETMDSGLILERDRT